MPRRITSRSRSSSTKSAAWRATSTAPSTERLVSAACIAGASLMPSPRKPTTWPVFFSARMMRSFWFGSTSTKRSVSSAACHSASSCSSSSCCAGEHALVRHADGGRNVARHGARVAGDQLERHAELREVRDRCGDAFLRSIEEGQESLELEVVLAVAVHALRVLKGACRQGKDADSLVSPRRRPFPQRVPARIVKRAAACDRRARRQHLLERALGDESQACRIAHGDAQALADEVVRNLGHLLDRSVCGSMRLDDRLVQRIDQP